MIEVLEIQFRKNVYWIPTIEVSHSSTVRNIKMDKISLIVTLRQMRGKQLGSYCNSHKQV